MTYLKSTKSALFACIFSLVIIGFCITMLVMNKQVEKYVIMGIASIIFFLPISFISILQLYQIRTHSQEVKKST